MGAAAIDLGQTLTIKVDALNDDGKGVTWSCAGDACAKLTSTSRWATFLRLGRYRNGDDHCYFHRAS